MEPTRNLLSWSNGSQPVERITLDDDGKPICPNNFPHLPHGNAVWLDWQSVQVWECPGLPFTTIEE